MAEEKIISLGGKNGWSQVPTRNGVTVGVGSYGYESLELATDSRTVSSDTDLLVDFENDVITDRAGNYTITENAVITTPRAKMGKGAGLVRGGTGIRLSGREGSVFGTSGLLGSFLIEFWLNPSIAENGETVFSWRSSRTVNNMPMYQMINASFYKNHLEWVFTNVFTERERVESEIRISSYSTIIPNVWTHHAISFDQESGLLEYRINGRLEALQYVTTNGQELGGSVLNAVLGVIADIDICPDYTGLVDDFHIHRQAGSKTATQMRYDTYSSAGGRFVSEPLLVSQNATLTQVDAALREPAQTSVVLYVRSGDNYFSWNDSEPAWIPVTNHAQLADIQGLYFQIAADLYPDGAGATTPSVMQIDLHFSEVPAPLPPFRVAASAGDGQVTLSWTYSVDNTTGGYYVYYGERPGEYLGREAVQGESPVMAGNVNTITFTGLKNGKIYYFAVAAYSKENSKIMGSLSKEVYARPLKR